MKINLGCGYKTFKGYVNIDYIPGKGVDKIMDLDNYPWDIESNVVDEIYCDNIVEHLDFAKTTKEIHRILKKGGIAIIKVPYFSNPGAFFADHKCFFNFYSYDKYCTNMSYDNMDIAEPFFELITRKITFFYEYQKGINKFLLMIFYMLPKIFYTINPKLYIRLFSYIFPASEIHWKLKKI
ncbi:MAG: methyltransferase domain-containing protein [Candidatus Absconditicoccaceae bacterium]